MFSMLSLLTLAATVAALEITSPTKSDVWSTGTSQTIEWDSVSSDQDTFNIYLSNMASYPSTMILLASDVSASDGSATIDGSKLTEGTAFTINLTNGTETAQIYAQSGQFNITEGSSSSSSSSSSASATATASTSSGTASSSTLVSSSTTTSSAAATTSSSSATKSANSTTGSSTASSTDASSTASATGSSATGSAASASATAASGAGKTVAGLMGAIAVAVMAL